MNEKQAKSVRRLVNNQQMSIIKAFLSEICQDPLWARIRFAWRIVIGQFAPKRRKRI
jgi:hypothetical protein